MPRLFEGLVLSRTILDGLVQEMRSSSLATPEHCVPDCMADPVYSLRDCISPRTIRYHDSKPSFNRSYPEF